MWTKSLAAVLATAVLAVPIPAQEAAPRDPNANKPEFIKSSKAPGLNVRFVDFKWDEAAFDAIEKGTPHPAATRSWVLARLMLEQEPMKWNGRSIPVGPVVLVLNPAKGGFGPSLEARYIDMREVFLNDNVIAEPPPGETYMKVPAVFHKVSRVAPRLEVSVAEKGKGYDLLVHYGNRETTLRFER
jgi:hypothetical protein